MIRPPPSSPLFPYTPLFHSAFFRGSGQPPRPGSRHSRNSAIACAAASTVSLRTTIRSSGCLANPNSGRKDSALLQDELRQSFEHHDGLVSPGHDGFGNGDQLVLLAEHAQP